MGRAQKKIAFRWWETPTGVCRPEALDSLASLAVCVPLSVGRDLVNEIHSIVPILKAVFIILQHA